MEFMLTDAMILHFTSLSSHTSDLVVIIILYFSAKEQYLLSDPNFQP